MAINVLVFSGNCGSDLELRFLPSGTAIGTVNVPCKSGWGEKEKTAWITCKVFGDRAEKLAPHVLKGALVTISGRFELEQWEKDGVKHSRPVCIVDNIQLAPKSSGDYQGRTTAPAIHGASSGQVNRKINQAADYRAAQEGSGGGGFSDFDDGIPFSPFGRELLV